MSHMLSGQEIQYSDVITSPVCCSCRSDPLFHAFLCHWDLCRDLQKNSLNWKNYSQRFHLLLHLEELQLKTDIEQYHKDDVPMFRYKNNTDLLVLRVIHLSHKIRSKNCHCFGHQLLPPQLRMTQCVTH